MANHTKKVTQAFIGDLTLKFTSDVVDGEPLDTRVEVEAGRYLVTVAGGEKMEFILALQEVVNRFRI